MPTSQDTDDKSKIAKLTEDISELETEAQEDLNEIVPLKLEKKDAKKELAKAESEVEMVNVSLRALNDLTRRNQSRNSGARSKGRRPRSPILTRRLLPKPVIRALQWTLRWKRSAIRSSTTRAFFRT